MYTGVEGQVEWSGRESFCKEGTFKLRLGLVRRSETGEEWWAGHFRSYQGRGREQAEGSTGIKP